MSQKQACDREGVFRGTISEYGLKEFDSGAVAVKFRADLAEIWDAANQAWHPWAEYEMEVFGDAFVVKKDGTLNEASVNSLVKNAGWDGSFHSITDGKWQPTPCQFTVKRSEYNGKTYYNAAFINGFDDIPGGGALPKLDEDKTKSLDKRFASQLRAIAGNKMRNQAVPPPADKPSAPPKPAANATKQRETVPPAAGDDIPF